MVAICLMVVVALAIGHTLHQAAQDHAKVFYRVSSVSPNGKLIAAIATRADDIAGHENTVVIARLGGIDVDSTSFSASEIQAWEQLYEWGAISANQLVWQSDTELLVGGTVEPGDTFVPTTVVSKTTGVRVMLQRLPENIRPKKYPPRH
jgi:hypothetical protein